MSYHATENFISWRRFKVFLPCLAWRFSYIAIFRALGFDEIAHLTGKQTMALFAENEDIVGMLRALGVDYAQGLGVSPSEYLTLA